MGARAGLFPDLGSTLKDQMTIGVRVYGVGSVNGALPAVPGTAQPTGGTGASGGANRSKGAAVSRTGTGTYTFVVQNNALSAGGYNLTPQWIQQFEVNFVAASGTKWAWQMTSYAFSGGVLTITFLTFVSTSGAATDVPSNDEMWITLMASPNTVA